jgi:hypothetical protein
MQNMTLEQAADYIADARITATQDYGFILMHTGINAAGALFVLVNDALGRVAVFEEM